MQHMEGIDILITALLCIGLVEGLFKGLVKQLFSLASLIVGVVAGNVLCPYLADMFGDGESGLARAVAFLLIFFIVVLAGGLLARLLGKVVHAIDMGWLNRLSGGALGVLKYLVITGVAFNLIESVQLEEKIYPEGFKEKSYYYKLSKNCLNKIMPYVSEFGNAASDVMEDIGRSGYAGGAQAE